MTLMELRAALEAGGAVYGRHFTFGGLGDDLYGIEIISGTFCTYHATHIGSPRKSDYVRYETEEDACAALQDWAMEAAKADGSWTA